MTEAHLLFGSSSFISLAEVVEKLRGFYVEAVLKVCSYQLLVPRRAGRRGGSIMLKFNLSSAYVCA